MWSPLRDLIAACFFVFCASAATGLSANDQEHPKIPEGFCGRDAAQACAADLGVDWTLTPMAIRLDESPITDLATVMDCMGSLGLHVYACRLTPESSPVLANLFLQRPTELRGIALVSSDTPLAKETGAGHFLLISGISVDGDQHYASTFDSGNGTVGRINVGDGTDTPLLLVSENPIEIPGRLDFLWVALVRALSSGWLFAAALTIVAATLAPRFINFEVKLKANRKSAAFCSIVLAPVLLVLSVVTYQSRSHAALESAAGFSQPKFHFGEVKSGTKVSGHVTMGNHGLQPLKIKSLTGSCGCMTIPTADFTVAPGSKVQIPIEFSAANLGHNQYSLQAETTNGIARCDIEFIGLPSVRLTPSKLVIGSLQQHGPRTLNYCFEVQGGKGVTKLLAMSANGTAPDLNVVRIRRDQEVADRFVVEFEALPSVDVSPGIHFTSFEALISDDLGKHSEQLTIGFEQLEAITQ